MKKASGRIHHHLGLLSMSRSHQLFHLAKEKLEAIADLSQGIPVVRDLTL